MTTTIDQAATSVAEASRPWNPSWSLMIQLVRFLQTLKKAPGGPRPLETAAAAQLLLLLSSFCSFVAIGGRPLMSKLGLLDSSWSMQLKKRFKRCAAHGDTSL